MVATQVEQVLKAQNDLLDELNNKNDFAVRVATRTGRMTQEPLYPEGHPKRIEQDSQRNNLDAPSPSKKKKNKNDRCWCQNRRILRMGSRTVRLGGW